MTALRVGFFTECYRPIVNGIVASIDALRGGLASAGHSVFCVAPEVPGYVERDPSIVRVPSLPLPTQTAYRLVLPIAPPVMRELARGVSIVHTHSPFVTGWMGARLARRYGVPLVFTYHTRLEQYAHYVPFQREMTQRAAMQLTRSYANGADAVIVPTQAMERRLRELGVRAPIAVIPSSIDVAQFTAGVRRADLRARLGARGETKLVLFVSRLAREKNAELAIDSFARMQHGDVRLAIVGDGPHRRELEARARRAGVADRTHFSGALAHDALPDVYACADAFIFTSTTETQGLVLAEAMAAGVPVVAVDGPVVRDVLGGTAALYGADPHSLGARLDQAVEMSLRNESAVHLAFERFSVSVQTRRILEIYGALVTRKSA